VREGPRLRGFPVFGAGAAGLVLGHAIAYLIAIPDPHQRAFALQRTGHIYLPALDQVVMMLAIAGGAAVVVRAFGAVSDQGFERFGRLARVLVLVQSCAFAAQEVLERLVSRSPLSGLFHDHVLVTGMVVQVAVAIAAAGILWLLARASTRLAATVTVRFRLPRHLPVFAVPATARRPLVPLFATADGARAPPSP